MLMPCGDGRDGRKMGGWSGQTWGGWSTVDCELTQCQANFSPRPRQGLAGTRGGGEGLEPESEREVKISEKQENRGKKTRR